MGNDNADNESRDWLYLAGGIALMVLGAGLITAHPAVRKGLQAGLASVLPDVQSRLGKMSAIGAVVPDIQRYMKLRSM